MAALDALPKPVTDDDVRACAQAQLQGKRQGDFLAWMDDNAAYLLGRLNG